MMDDLKEISEAEAHTRGLLSCRVGTRVMLANALVGRIVGHAVSKNQIYQYKIRIEGKQEFVYAGRNEVMRIDEHF